MDSLINGKDIAPIAAIKDRKNVRVVLYHQGSLAHVEISVLLQGIESEIAQLKKRLKLADRVMERENAQFE